MKNHKLDSKIKSDVPKILNNPSSTNKISGQPYNLEKNFKNAVGKEQQSSNDNCRQMIIRPGDELLNFYKSKVNELNLNHDVLSRRLDSIEAVCDAQNAAQRDLQQREDEIADLQKALSDMQVYLFKEREQVLRLYSENDRLKIREMDDRKKIQHLLQLSGLTKSEITYFIREPNTLLSTGTSADAAAEENSGTYRPAAVLIEPSHRVRTVVMGADGRTNKKMGGDSGASLSARQRHAHTDDHDKHGGAHGGASLVELEASKRQAETLRLQVQALQNQIEEKSRLSKEQIEMLLEDRRVAQEEAAVQRNRDKEGMDELMNRLKRTQDLLRESTQDFLNQRKVNREADKQWMNEKDKLMRLLDAREASLQFAKKSHESAKSTMQANKSAGNYVGVEEMISEAQSNNTEKKIKQQQSLIFQLETQLDEQQQLAEMYREQVVDLEDQLGQVKEKGHLTQEVFKEKSEKSMEQLRQMRESYKQLEKRRNLEVEGFQTDIVALRKKLKILEGQLYKVVIGMGSNSDILKIPGENDGRNEMKGDDLDLTVLKNIRATRGQSQKLNNQLKDLKAMMYGLENQLRKL